MNVVDVQKFEDKLREAEKRLGITDGVPVTYERGGEAVGKLLLSLLLVAIIVSILARSKSIRPPISIDSFVSAVCSPSSPNCLRPISDSVRTSEVHSS